MIIGYIENQKHNTTLIAREPKAQELPILSSQICKNYAEDNKKRYGNLKPEDFAKYKIDALMNLPTCLHLIVEDPKKKIIVGAALAVDFYEYLGTYIFIYKSIFIVCL